jgi:toxin ParE1/3/4
MPTIVLRREARLDLEKIDNFSRETFGNDTADIYMSEFTRAFRVISEYPEIGAAFRSRKAPLRSYPAGSHRIFYYFDGQRVVIVRVLHMAMNAGTHLRR